MLEQQLQQGGAPAAAAPGASVAPAAPGPSGGSLPPVGAPPAVVNQGYPPARESYPVPQAAPPLDLTEQSPARGGRRGDAFDPAANPRAPGVPRPLGSTPPTPPPADIGAPGGRNAGEPLNLNTALPGGAAGGLTTAPPSGTPRDEFDLGIGYIQRKDYALAEETMRNFAKRYPSDALVGDAQYWLGESLYQRQRYRDAAEAFLAVTTTYERTGKAPDALLRLGQSLAALKEKEAACAALGEVTRKYPKASSGVKNGVTREQKRIGC
jgi:tol-pal system protein YbgF